MSVFVNHGSVPIDLDSGASVTVPSYLTVQYQMQTQCFSTIQQQARIEVRVAAEQIQQGRWNVAQRGMERHATGCLTAWAQQATNNNTVYTNPAVCSNPFYGETPPVDVKARLRMTMRGWYSTLVASNALERVLDQREARARMLLRRLIGEQQYRRFLRRGKVSVKGKSGRTYSIKPASGQTTVYENNKAIAKMCVVLNGQYPPTDSLVARLLMILGDEDAFWAKANVTRLSDACTPLVGGDVNRALDVLNDAVGHTNPSVGAIPNDDRDRSEWTYQAEVAAVEAAVRASVESRCANVNNDHAAAAVPPDYAAAFRRGQRNAARTYGHAVPSGCEGPLDADEQDNLARPTNLVSLFADYKREEASNTALKARRPVYNIQYAGNAYTVIANEVTFAQFAS